MIKGCSHGTIATAIYVSRQMACNETQGSFTQCDFCECDCYLKHGLCGCYETVRIDLKLESV